MTFISTPTGVKTEWIDGFNPLEIIETPELGRLSAEFMCLKLKIASQKDVDKVNGSRAMKCYPIYDGALV